MNYKRWLTWFPLQVCPSRHFSLRMEWAIQRRFAKLSRCLFLQFSGQSVTIHSRTIAFRVFGGNENSRDINKVTIYYYDRFMWLKIIMHLMFDLFTSTKWFILLNIVVVSFYCLFNIFFFFLFFYFFFLAPNNIKRF